MNIKKLRGRLNLTQIALAKKLNWPPYVIDRWERGVEEPPRPVIRKLKELEENAPRLKMK